MRGVIMNIRNKYLARTKVELLWYPCLVGFSVFILVILLWYGLSQGRIQRICSYCHTMHNSQDFSLMTFYNSRVPNDNLTRGTCLGCHAQQKWSSTVDLGEYTIPQVMHL